MMTTNISESFNSLLKSARKLPVTAMVRLTYKQVGERFVTRSAYGRRLSSENERWMTNPMNRFESNRLKAARHSLINYHQEDENLFEVKTNTHNGRGGNVHTVNASRRVYQCGKWQSYHIPCSHALRGFESLGYNAWDYIAKKYSVHKYKKTYSGGLSPLDNDAYWPTIPFSMIANKNFLRKIRVNATTRIHNAMDVPASTLSRKCSSCQQTGHVKRNCGSRDRNASSSPRTNTSRGGSSSRS